MVFYRWFWSLLTIAVLAWYSSVTLYIAYQGAINIRQMLKRLSKAKVDLNAPES